MMLREPWRTRLLFLSFAVNLLAVPMAASRYVFHHPALPPEAPPPQVMIERMASRLSDSDAEKLRTAMAPHIQDIQVARARMEAARHEMSRILIQPQFDRDAARTAITKWQDQWHLWSRSFGDAMLDVFAQISVSGRVRLAEQHHPGRR